MPRQISPYLLHSVSPGVAFPTPMNAYDGCHITIHVPVDFGTEKEKELRQSFTQELPGSTLTIQGRESVAKPRIGEISIDDFAYVRSAKAAEEWKNVAEKAELKNDAFPVVDWAASRTLRQFLQGHKSALVRAHSAMTP